MAYVSRYRDVCLPDANRFKQQFCNPAHSHPHVDTPMARSSLAAQTIPQPTVIGVDGGEGSGILTYLPLFRATKKRSPNQISDRHNFVINNWGEHKRAPLRRSLPPSVCMYVRTSPVTPILVTPMCAQLSI
uniref:Uncharacterized protein n=1 Tax=Amphimedon queenslandica TaxID=400682 RepID=A0A1X7SN82_AMPQE